MFKTLTGFPCSQDKVKVIWRGCQGLGPCLRSHFVLHTPGSISRHLIILPLCSSFHTLGLFSADCHTVWGFHLEWASLPPLHPLISLHTNSTLPCGLNVLLPHSRGCENPQVSPPDGSPRGQRPCVQSFLARSWRVMNGFLVQQNVSTQGLSMCLLNE